ncbi:methyltransferase domain-containing protein [Novosphingobium sp. BL-8H]|uniref:class I SAM-dependent methyltransferase n=1 Tax=Novosphingobium sp. BL-8H TaxID=3127640 RepID=UPI003756A25D
MADSDHNWRLWGERDPYYAVLTHARFRSDSIEDHRREFFEGGEVFVSHWLSQIERYFGALPRGRALDFGCGVGRLTLPLADHFESAVGLDIAPAMLAEARRNSDGRPIDYLLSDDSLSRVEGSFDFVISCIVLQHIPVARGMAILGRLLDRVNPGGGAIIQLSTRRNHSRWQRLGEQIRHTVPGGQAVMNLLGGRAADTPVMQMNEYPLDGVLRLFDERGFHEMLVRYQNHGGTDAAMIIARRSYA